MNIPAKRLPLHISSSDKLSCASRAGTAKVLPGGAACVGRIEAGAFDVADAFGVDTRGAWGAS